MRSADEATWQDLARVHPEAFLRKFKEMSDAGGGTLGLRTAFTSGGFEQASLSAGLARDALFAVLQGDLDNAYALSRPPGHHCLPDFPNGSADLCGGRLVLVHEGGYSEVYVPFCGHHVLQQLSGSAITAADPLGETFAIRQPSERLARMHSSLLDDLETLFR